MDTPELLNLLTCPHSPWYSNETWSPEAAALRRLAVETPRRLTAGFIHRYFTTLLLYCGQKSEPIDFFRWFYTQGIGNKGQLIS